MKDQNAEIHIIIKDGNMDSSCSGNSWAIVTALEAILASAVWHNKKPGVPLKVLADDEKKHILMYLCEIERQQQKNPASIGAGGDLQNRNEDKLDV